MFKMPLMTLALYSVISPVCADTYPVDDLITEPRPEKFSFCFHGTCEETRQVSLTTKQWQHIRNIFKEHKGGLAEREQIKQAIALMEDMVGKLTGTSVDKAGTFAYLGEQGQLDCIDESVNTSFYMKMMLNDGLIRTHTVEDRAHRGFFINGWPHSTAVIRSTESNELYAVDAWFEDNGIQPHIIPLEEWDNGWKPAHF